MTNQVWPVTLIALVVGAIIGFVETGTKEGAAIAGVIAAIAFYSAMTIA